MLEDYHGKITHLTLDCGALHIWESVWNVLCTMHLPQLERISSTVQQPGPSGPQLFLEDISRPMQPMQLVELRLSGAPVFLPGATNYASLTALRLCNLTGRRAIPWSAFSSLLLCTTQLRLLQVSVVEWTAIPNPVPAIQLPTLSDLHIKFADGVSIVPLAQIAMPAITLLHLHIINDDLEDFVVLFESIIERVQYLKLRLVTKNHTHLTNMMKTLKNLKELDLCRNDRDIVNYIVEDLGTDIKYSKLETLVIACEIGYEARAVLFDAFGRNFRLIRREHSRSHDVREWTDPSSSSGSTVKLTGRSHQFPPHLTVPPPSTCRNGRCIATIKNGMINIVSVKSRK
ncbi:hypothetical protein B0H12DRAFT_1078860 [Mycena haematopus]|nr:hypothetical protein B0H12DRAFT_1083327 [Mycena haematopus]KAJ7216873.1 hypothetical protein B0H12DRAFT_1078860 [Mycena haematopus]